MLKACVFILLRLTGWMSFNFLKLARKATKWNYSGGLGHPKDSWKQSRKYKKAHKQSKEMLKTRAFNFLRLIEVNALTIFNIYRKNPQMELFWWPRTSQRPLETIQKTQESTRTKQRLDELQFSHTSKKSHQMKLFWWSRASQRLLETIKKIQESTQTKQRLDELQPSHTSKKSHQMKLFCWSMASQRLLETIKTTQDSTQTKQRYVKDLRFQFFEVNSSECANISAYLQENPTKEIILVV